MGPPGIPAAFFLCQPADSFSSCAVSSPAFCRAVRPSLDQTKFLPEALLDAPPDQHRLVTPKRLGRRRRIFKDEIVLP
jgi:hypothetical protein